MVYPKVLSPPNFGGKGGSDDSLSDDSDSSYEEDYQDTAPNRLANLLTQDAAQASR